MVPETSETEFNTLATFWFRMDRVLRVYATPQELLFIRIGGQPVDWAAALGQLGLPGRWLGRKLNARREAAVEARAAKVDRMSPQVLVDQHPHSFRTSLSEIESASFDPGAAISLHGPHHAVWRLKLRDGRSWRFQFEEVSEAATALRVLRSVLGDTLAENAVWDEQKGRFRRARAQEAASRVGAS